MTKKLSQFVAAAALLLTFGCASGPEGTNLVGGTEQKGKSGYQPRGQDDRLPYQKRMDDQVGYPLR